AEGRRGDLLAVRLLAVVHPHVPAAGLGRRGKRDGAGGAAAQVFVAGVVLVVGGGAAVRDVGRHEAHPGAGRPARRGGELDLDRIVGQVLGLVGLDRGGAGGGGEGEAEGDAGEG